MSAGLVDCLIVGGGPAGLTAAIYAARFRLSVCLIDAGQSRAALIPLTRNLAGFPDGIAGVELLQRMRAQAERWGAELRTGKVDRLVKDGACFIAFIGEQEVKAKAVLIATGVTNRRPPMTDALHLAALAAGRLRYCPVCDGFEVIDQDVAVIGTGAHGVREALFLRSFTDRLTLIAPDETHDLDDAQRRTLAEADVTVSRGPAEIVALEPSGLRLGFAGSTKLFESVYPAMGSIIHSDLAAGVGAAVTTEGCLKVDAHQRTTVDGLYAAGDVVVGLDQINHAAGEAGVAATTIPAPRAPPTSSGDQRSVGDSNSPRDAA
jgi:thioredoxin reductase (NADPH)